MAYTPFGSPYPARAAAPTSRVIDNPLTGLGSYADWDRDWNARYQAEADRAKGGSVTGTIAHSGNRYAVDNLSPQAMSIFRDDPAFGQVLQGMTLTEGYKPDFQELLAERDRLAPAWENQVRQQQAYDTQLMGNNAQNGLMPAGYTATTFGQVTGQPRAGGLGGLGGFDLTGVGPDSQSGAYGAGAGAYTPQQPKNPWSGF